jgi:hypothetical protein
MLSVVKEMNEDLTVIDLGEVYNFLEDKSSKYDSVDGNNRIEPAFDELKTLTKGRTRLSENV